MDYSSSSSALLSDRLSKTMDQNQERQRMIDFSSAAGHLDHRWCLYDPRWQAVRVSLLGGWNWRDEQSIDTQLATLSDWLKKAPQTYFPETNQWSYEYYLARVTAETQIFNLIDAVFYSWGSETGKNSKAIHDSGAYQRIMVWRQDTRDDIVGAHWFFDELQTKYPGQYSTKVVLLKGDEQRRLFMGLSMEIQLLICRDLRKRWRHAIRKAKATGGEDMTQLLAEAKVQRTRKELHAFCLNTGIEL